MKIQVEMFVMPDIGFGKTVLIDVENDPFTFDRGVFWRKQKQFALKEVKDALENSMAIKVWFRTKEEEKFFESFPAYSEVKQEILEYAEKLLA